MAEERKPTGIHPADQKRALLQAAQAAVADAESRDSAPPRPRRSRLPGQVLMVVSAVLIAAGAWLLAVRPTWFFVPPPPPPPEEVQDASLRLTLVREANRVEQFRAEKHRLPTSLAELGSPVSGISYERKDDSIFVLRARQGSGDLTLASTDSVAGFLGRSVELVTPRRGQ